MKGICFTESMFNAVIEGRKIQTRRIINPQPDDDGLHDDDKFPRSLKSTLTGFNGTVNEIGESKEFKPRYRVGDVVYLKEPYFITKGKPYYLYGKPEQKFMPDRYWKNKLFMPEKYARYFIEITDVRCERLRDISDEDCLKEGIKKDFDFDGIDVCYFNKINHTKKINGFLDIAYKTPQEAYAYLIEKINGKGTWNSNPFVWVYDFILKK